MNDKLEISFDVLNNLKIMNNKPFRIYTKKEKDSVHDIFLHFEGIKAKENAPEELSISVTNRKQTLIIDSGYIYKESNKHIFMLLEYEYDCINDKLCIDLIGIYGAK